MGIDRYCQVRRRVDWEKRGKNAIIQCGRGRERDTLTPKDRSDLAYGVFKVGGKGEEIGICCKRNGGGKKNSGSIGETRVGKNVERENLRRREKRKKSGSL